jgi:transposase
MSDTLFPVPPAEVPDHLSAPSPAPRVERPNRAQLELRSVDLDGLLPADHRARLVWEFVEGLDLSPLYAIIRAVDGGAGRPAIDPAILTALWLYATLEGVGSARALDRLCEQHDAYRWLAGGVSVNYHTLAAFRVAHADVLDTLLTRSVATLMAEGLVTLTRVAQDGVRVRASAGAGSFRRRERLQQFLREAADHVRALRRELEEDPAATSRRQAAARTRAAQERHARVQKALEQLADVEAQHTRAQDSAAHRRTARASTTDPAARVMKMADGGFRPAFNPQFAADTSSQIIVGADATNLGSDLAHLPPMVDQLRRRYGRPPAEVLADGNFAGHEALDILAAAGCVVYVPVPQPRKSKTNPEALPRDPHAPRPTDSPAVAAWRHRMGTPAAHRIYKLRAATVECINAIARNRGLQQFGVRGLAKVRAVVLWFALAHNLLRAAQLRRLAAAAT